ncbi:hypothetical protein [Limnobaculum parvum]|nr:hypothetical protein [Limnobaculum parvum]
MNRPESKEGIRSVYFLKALLNKMHILAGRGIVAGVVMTRLE